MSKILFTVTMTHIPLLSIPYLNQIQSWNLLCFLVKSTFVPHFLRLYLLAVIPYTSIEGIFPQRPHCQLCIWLLHHLVENNLIHDSHIPCSLCTDSIYWRRIRSVVLIILIYKKLFIVHCATLISIGQMIYWVLNCYYQTDLKKFYTVNES